MYKIRNREFSGSARNLRDVERDFVQNVRPGMAAYYNTGSGSGTTLANNMAAFKHYMLKPCLLPDGATEQQRDIDVSTNLLGTEVSCPIGISPTAFQRAIWLDGEMSTARAAANQNVCFINSLFSGTSVADISGAMIGRSLLWKNIYPFTEDGIEARRALVKNSAKYGVSAFVLTIDAPVLGWTSRPEWTIDLFSYEIPDVTLACKQAGLETNTSAPEVCLRYANSTSFTWRGLKELTMQTDIPVVVKGILTAEDACLAVSHGALGVCVSNHGGRQLDGSTASLHALPDVASAVGEKVPVYLDGGVRSGVDVFKALALGADAVFLGRPILWGLGRAGSEGVEEVIDILRGELVEAMIYTGCSSLKDINKSKLVKVSHL